VTDAQGRQFDLGSSDANIAAYEHYKLGAYTDDVQPNRAPNRYLSLLLH
jgi:hypothetical protein